MFEARGVRATLLIAIGVLSVVWCWPGSSAAAEAAPQEPAVETAEEPSKQAEGERRLLPSLLGATPEERARLAAERRRLSEIAAENGTDPTAIVTFAQLSYEHDSFTIPLRLDLVRPFVRLAVTPSWVLSVTMPYVWADPNRAGTSSTNGATDMTVRTGWRVYSSSNLALFLGTDATFPTASKETLGLGKYTLGPAVAVALPMARLRSLLFVLAQDFRSVGGDPSRPDVHFSRVQTVFNTIWSERWWTTLELLANANWEQNGKSGGTLESELGYRFDDRWRIFVRPGIGLWGKSIPQAFDWNFEAGVRFMFKGSLLPKAFFEGFKGD
jgi:hypothetical protein